MSSRWKRCLRHASGICIRGAHRLARHRGSWGRVRTTGISPRVATTWVAAWARRSACHWKVPGMWHRWRPRHVLGTEQCARCMCGLPDESRPNGRCCDQLCALWPDLPTICVAARWSAVLIGGERWSAFRCPSGAEGMRRGCHHGEGAGSHRCLVPTPLLAVLSPCPASLETEALVPHGMCCILV